MSSQRLVCSRQGRRLLLLIWTSGLPEPAKANEKVKFDALFFCGFNDIKITNHKIYETNYSNIYYVKFGNYRNVCPNYRLWRRHSISSEWE